MVTAITFLDKKNLKSLSMKRVYGHMLEVELNFRGRTEVSSKFILRLIIFNQEQQKHEGIVFKEALFTLTSLKLDKTPC